MLPDTHPESGTEMVALVGHLTMTIGGVSTASPSSIVTVSTAVMAPLASSVILDNGASLLDVGSRARPVFQRWPGHLHAGVVDLDTYG
jgi:hypothetical protein